MAKRDRDTAIWKNKFYKGLPPLYKCFWDFINDECDNAGVWLEDFAGAKNYIGKKVSAEKALELFGDRIQVFDNGEKWHIKTFISERLGFSELNPAHKFQKSIIDLLVKHKIEKIGVYPDTLQSVKEREGQEKDKGKEREKGVQGENLFPSQILQADELCLEDLSREASSIGVKLPECLDNWDGWYCSKFTNWRRDWVCEKLTFQDLRKSFEAWMRDPKSRDNKPKLNGISADKLQKFKSL